MQNVYYRCIALGLCKNPMEYNNGWQSVSFMSFFPVAKKEFYYKEHYLVWLARHLVNLLPSQNRGGKWEIGSLMNYDQAKGDSVPGESRVKVVSVSIGSRSCSLVFLLLNTRWEKQLVLQKRLQNFKEEVWICVFLGVWIGFSYV